MTGRMSGNLSGKAKQPQFGGKKLKSGRKQPKPNLSGGYGVGGSGRGGNLVARTASLFGTGKAPKVVTGGNDGKDMC